VALGLRVTAIAALPFTVDPTRHAFTSYFGDAVYAIQRSIWIRNAWVGIPVAARDYIEAFEPSFGYTGYHYVLAYLHVLFGPSPYGITLVSTGLLLTSAVMIYRRCRAAFGALAAFGGFVVVLFIPTWVAWSVAPLKEAMQLVLITSAVEATIVAVRGRRALKIVAVAALLVAILVGATLRNGAGAIMLGGVLAGLALYFGTRRWWIVAALLVVVPVVAIRVAERPAVRDRIEATVLDAAKRHVGHTRSHGAYYRLLDERFYLIPNERSEEKITMSVAEGVRFLGFAPLAFLTAPWPWALDSPKWMAFIPQQVVWYALLVLSVVGVVAGGRRDPLLTSLLVGFIACAVAVISPNSGNIGTAIRHRDMIVPLVAALAGIGGQAVANRCARSGATAGDYVRDRAWRPSSGGPGRQALS
jgi:hypothetical protein